MSAVCGLAAEVQELRLVVRRLAGSIMWDRGAVILGKRIPERVVEQTVDMPVPQIAGEIVAPVPQFWEETGEVRQLSPLQHAHFGREPFGKDGRKYFDGEDSKDLIKYPPLTLVPQVHERTVDQPGGQACRDPTDLVFLEVVDVRVVMQRQVPQVQIMPKAVEAPLGQFVGRVVDALAFMQVRQCWPEMSPLRTRRNCDHMAVVSVDGLTQVTLKFWCCRATHMFRRRPAKIRDLEACAAHTTVVDQVYEGRVCSHA